MLSPHEVQVDGDNTGLVVSRDSQTVSVHVFVVIFLNPPELSLTHPPPNFIVN